MRLVVIVNLRLHERNWTVIRDKYHVIDLSAEYTHSDKIQFTVGHVRDMRRAVRALEGSQCEHVAFTIYQIRSIYGVRLENFFPRIMRIREPIHI